MDDLRNQLRQLGEAAEADVAPINVAQIQTPAESTRIDTADQSAMASRPAGTTRRRISRRVILGAAAASLVLLGSLVLVDRSTSEDAVGITSAQEAAPEPAVPADDNGWAKLRFCESSSDYTVDTGNTFYGAYQFTWSQFRETAARLGLHEYTAVNPATAPPEIQDAVASAIYLQHGAQAWPICGRHLRGPMITPVVPQWLSGPDTRNALFVHITPEATKDRLDEIGLAIDEIAKGDPDTRITFTDQDQAFEEFQQTFLDNDDALRSVDVADMPARFEVFSELSRESVQDIRDIQGVLAVVEPQGFGGYGPLHLSIPTIDIDTPVYPSATTEHLALGPVAMSARSYEVAIAGFGSVPGSVFERLDELRSGDLVSLSILYLEDGASYEVTQAYEVKAVTSQSPPAISPVDELTRSWTGAGPDLVLVADVAGDPRQRLVVHFGPVDPDLTRYILPGDA